MTDRLTLTRAFEGAGISSDVAERIATEIYDAIHDNVATKADLYALEQRLETRFDALEQRLTLRFEQVDRRIDNVNAHLERRIDYVVVRLGGLVVVVAGILFAALHIWPAH